MTDSELKKKTFRTPTLVDIALRAGVSKATVSIVLNNRRSPIKISEDTKNRVIEAAHELNYAPNRLARSFSMDRSFTIGIITQKPLELFDSAFSFGVMTGIAEVAQKRNYNLMLFNEDVISDPRLSESYAHLISDRHVDGILFLTSDYPDTILVHKVKELSEREMAYVFMWRKVNSVDGTMIGVNNELGGRIATEYLLSLGHRRIGVIARGERSWSSQERLKSISATLKKHGVDLDKDNIFYNSSHPDDDEKTLDRVLQLSNRPSALVVLYDPIAINMINLLSNRGLCVPDDMSVIGFGDVLLAPYSRPSLTTVREPLVRMGREAATILIDKIENPEMSAMTMDRLFDPELIVRGSCKEIKN